MERWWWSQHEAKMRPIVPTYFFVSFHPSYTFFFRRPSPPYFFAPLVPISTARKFFLSQFSFLPPINLHLLTFFIQQSQPAFPGATNHKNPKRVASVAIWQWKDTSLLSIDRKRKKNDSLLLTQKCVSSSSAMASQSTTWPVSSQCRTSFLLPFLALLLVCRVLRPVLS